MLPPGEREMQMPPPREGGMRMLPPGEGGIRMPLPSEVGVRMPRPEQIATTQLITTEVIPLMSKEFPMVGNMVGVVPRAQLPNEVGVPFQHIAQPPPGGPSLLPLFGEVVSDPPTAREPVMAKEKDEFREEDEVGGEDMSLDEEEEEGSSNLITSTQLDEPALSIATSKTKPPEATVDAMLQSSVPSTGHVSQGVLIDYRCSNSESVCYKGNMCGLGKVEIIPSLTCP